MPPPPRSVLRPGVQGAAGRAGCRGRGRWLWGAVRKLISQASVPTSTTRKMSPLQRARPCPGPSQLPPQPGGRGHSGEAVRLPAPGLGPQRPRRRCASPYALAGAPRWGSSRTPGKHPRVEGQRAPRVPVRPRRPHRHSHRLSRFRLPDRNSSSAFLAVFVSQCRGDLSRSSREPRQVSSPPETRPRAVT